MFEWVWGDAGAGWWADVGEGCLGVWAGVGCRRGCGQVRMHACTSVW